MKRFFFGYSEGEKRAILLLLFLAIVALGIRIFLQNNNLPTEKITENDSLRTAFDNFLAEQIASEKNYRDSLDAFYAEKRRSFEAQKEKWAKEKEERKIAQIARQQAFSNKTFEKQEKLRSGQTIGLNEADTTDWKKVPNIGSGFARRIVKYRNLLGGFASAEQLIEVYGFTAEMLTTVRPFLKTDLPPKQLRINRLTFEELRRHPYIGYTRAKAIVNLRERKGNIASWETLTMLGEFSDSDQKRLQPYISFE